MFIANLRGLVLRDGDVVLRPVRVRDSAALERELMLNRAWLRPWEATNPDGFISFDTRANVRALIAYSRSGAGIAFVIEVDGAIVGQVNVSAITHGSLSTAQIGYWVAERVAGRGITPAAVALVTDYCLSVLRVHRMEICIRPENQASLRVVEKLGFRYEGYRERYIHIAGAWRDHVCFAVTIEEVPEGVLKRWKEGKVPSHLSKAPPPSQPNTP